MVPDRAGCIHLDTSFLIDACKQRRRHRPNFQRPTVVTSLLRSKPLNQPHRP
jgi:hypothetical protein